jgi:hypothetical protein
MAQTNFTNLRVIVNSAQDTTLMIRGPDGVYRCADDVELRNPIIQGVFAPGAYQIWVGSYRNTENPPYVIGFTELSGTTAVSLGT